MRNVRRSRRDGLNVERGEGTSITRKFIRGKEKERRDVHKSKGRIKKTVCRRMEKIQTD